MIEFQPVDQAARRALLVELDTTFFVEASAGTGKTTALVRRVVELVANNRVEMPHLVAITFTDAAASELRDRIREALESAATDEKRSVEQQARCANAAGKIDLAAIQTLHSFAGALLRSFPIEAGLPPDFETLDAAEQGISFDERFRVWLYGDVMESDPDRRKVLRTAFGLGITPAHLHDIAWAMQDVYDLLDNEATWATETAASPISEAHRIGSGLLEVEPFLPPGCAPGDHETIASALGAIATGHELLSMSNEMQAVLALREFTETKGLAAGNVESWPDRASKGNVGKIKGILKTAKAEAEQCVDALCKAAFTDCLPHLRDLTLAMVGERRQRGQATFQDLLVWARDLLRDNPHIRQAAHETYQRVFVDEFQDTDPLQVEIAWYLTADPKQAHERNWELLRPLPGRLFIVGDPKQSIYRFRGADIAIYDQIAGLIQDDSTSVTLTQSFRSSRSVVDWVNDYFTKTMIADTGVQPTYGNLLPRPHDRGFDPAIGGVHLIGDASPENVAQIRQAEAEAIAIAIRRMRAESWTILDSKTGVCSSGSPRYRDMCILIPSRSNLSALERALDEYDIPYRMESGSLVMGTQVVRDVESCLKAIDDPSNQVSLVAALRSPAYGCSDVDLLDWVDRGGAFNYLRPGKGENEVVRQALCSLAALHHRRLDRSPAATIEELIHERFWAVQSFGERRPREMWRRLRWIVANAHDFATGENRSLRAFLDWMAERSRRSENVRESTVIDADEDAVRIMTIHGSKGLEFPIVFLANLSAGPRGDTSTSVVPIRSQKTIGIKVNKTLVTSNYEEARTSEHAEAESHRLLYVASTRARDHLVLSLFRKVSSKGKESNCHAASIARVMANGGSGLVSRLDLAGDGYSWPDKSGPIPMDSTSETSDDQTDEVTWVQERTALIDRLSQSPSVAANSLAGHESSAVSIDDDLSAPTETDSDDLIGGSDPTLGAFALRRGRAVHAVMERIKLSNLDRIKPECEKAGKHFGLQEIVMDIERLVRTLVNSPAVREGMSASREWREMSVSAPLGTSRVLIGVIDLVYERADGSLGVIDYKTDRVDDRTIDQRATDYRWQGAAYAAALERVTKRVVTSVDLVFAEAFGRAIRLDGDALRELIGSIKERIDLKDIAKHN